MPPEKDYDDASAYIQDCWQKLASSEQLQFSREQKNEALELIKDLTQQDIIVTDNASLNASIAAYKNS